jgi:hypothetical protein
VIWVLLLSFPTVQEPDLDISWRMCLGHFCKHHAQAGIDYIWTYGPLGTFLGLVYDPDLFWWHYAWELVVKGALAFLIVCLGGYLKTVSLRLLAFCGLAMVVLGPVNDPVYVLGIVSLGIIPLRRPVRGDSLPAWALVAGSVLLALLALTKFTFFLLAALVWLVLLAGLWRDRRQWVVVLLGFPVAVLTMWCLLGQSIWNFPRFLRAAFEISSGYSKAMSSPGDTAHILCAWAGLGSVALLACCYPRAAFRSTRNRLGLLLLASVLLFVWKHGFVRQDPPHTSIFFGFLLLAPVLVEVVLGKDQGPNRLWVLAVVLCLGTALAGAPILLPRAADLERWPANFVALLRPGLFRTDQERMQSVGSANRSLPGLGRLIGDGTVDMISHDQALVLGNGWNYHPRPVFQGYSAYTPALLEANAAFYRGPQAPAFVLCNLESVDRRLVSADDGPTLLEVLRAYRPAATERGYLLLRRIEGTQAPAAPRPILWEGTLTFEQALDLGELPGDMQTLSLGIEESAWGKLVTLVFRQPPVWVDLELENGDVLTRRLVPSIVAGEFLINPLVEDTEALHRLYRGQPLPRVRRLSVHVDPEHRGHFQDRITVTVREAALAGPAEGR